MCHKFQLTYEYGGQSVPLESFSANTCLKADEYCLNLFAILLIFYAFIGVSRL